MKITLYTLIIITLFLGGVAVALKLRPAIGISYDSPEKRFGVFEGLEVVGNVNKQGGETYSVEDESGQKLFTIPLRNCIIDSRFRDGRLRFRENGTNREGFIDRQGIITFTNSGNGTPTIPEEKRAEITFNTTAETPEPDGAATRNQSTDLRKMPQNNPFYKEAVKVLSGKLTEEDAERRHAILNYCEHFRTAYTTKDIDFLRQVFGEQALIIVGNVVKPKSGTDGSFLSGDRVVYNIRTKKEYINRLGKAFATNKQIDIRFSDFHIMRHPTIDGIYGVSLRQKYKSDRYTDDGYLFLLWDFRDKSMPLIHVRTWQPASTITAESDVMNLMDFNFE